MRKVVKDKIHLDDLLQQYENFVGSDGTINPDSGYHFVISINVMTQQGSESECKELCFYYHTKFLMSVESKIRSLLVHLDTILNPQKAGSALSDFQCMIRPYPKPQTSIISEDNIYSSEIYIGIKQVL